MSWLILLKATFIVQLCLDGEVVPDLDYDSDEDMVFILESEYRSKSEKKVLVIT